MVVAKGKTVVVFDIWKYENYLGFIWSKSKNIVVSRPLCAGNEMFSTFKIHMEPLIDESQVYW